jgi:hypothetical protein
MLQHNCTDSHEHKLRHYLSGSVRFLVRECSSVFDPGSVAHSYACFCAKNSIPYSSCIYTLDNIFMEIGGTPKSCRTPACAPRNAAQLSSIRSRRRMYTTYSAELMIPTESQHEVDKNNNSGTILVR